MPESEEPRYNIKSEHPVEQFYKRNSTADHPIPQVIIVGILRVLLTTCPNNNSKAGGVDLHSEWSACLDLLNEERDLFDGTEYASALQYDSENFK